MGLVAARRAALRETIYQGDPLIPGTDLDAVRTAIGGQLSRMPTTKLRWYPADVERVAQLAARGDLSEAAQLWQSAKSDGVVRGVLSTRTAGLVRLPKKFRGPDAYIEALTLGGAVAARSVFDDLAPAAELAAMASDAVGVGVLVGELVPVPGRAFPRLVRHSPEFLRYRINEDRWYLATVGGLVPVIPGDGRWVLHATGGRIAPWNEGLWEAVGRSWIRKVHADFGDENWRRKLANPARVAQAPQGSTEAQKQGFWQAVMAWGYNAVFGLEPGWEVKLLESNGRGYQSFADAIARSDREITIAIAGQVVTTDGGAGFQNSDIHRTIRADLIKQTADDLAYALNTQVLPIWALSQYGDAAETVTVAWDVDPPKDLAALANAMGQAGNAIAALDSALAQHSRRVDAIELLTRFGIPSEPADLDAAAATATAAAEPLTAESEQDATPTISP